MRKITILLSSLLLTATVFGQKSIQSNNLTNLTIKQVAKNTVSPISDEERLAQYPKTPSGHIRCIAPEYHEDEAQFESWISNKIAEMNANNTLMKASRNIPVVVHILHNGDAVGSNENISVAQIQSQIDVLNEDFSGTNSDISSVPAAFTSAVTDADIQFCLAQTDPLGQPTTGINRINIGVSSVSDSQIESNYGLNNMWDPTKYLNIFVGNLTGGLLGKAVFPTGSGLPGMPGGGAPSYDGVMVLYSAFGRVGTVGAPYNKGRTATHEIGHWLGLRHIWGDSNCGNDFCADTPTQQTSNGGCPTYPSPTCGNSGDMSMNYMDYTNDACMYMFTNDQKARMDAVLANSPQRVELLTSTACQVAAITADFVADVTTIAPGNSVNFTDLSSTPSPNVINSWTWSFPGGTPNSHVGQTPPAITYNTTGQYDVTLTVTDNFGGNDSETKTQYINVVVPGTCDTLNNPPNGTVTAYSTASGWLAGWNEYGDISKAEYISAAAHAPYTYVTGGLFAVLTANDGGNGATVDFNVWDASGTGGSPGAILGSVTVPLSALDFNAGYEQTLVEIMFDQAINVGVGDFYFGFTMNGFQASDTLGMYSNVDGDSSPGTAWEQWSDNDWYADSDGSSWGVNITQYFAPYLAQDAPTATISTNTTTICAGGSVNFDASSSSNTTGYDWIFNGGSPTSSTNTAETVSYAAAGTPRAYLIAYGNCGSYALDSVDITVNPAMTVGSASSTPTVCVNNAITNITHTTTNATGIGAATGLPAGVSANYSAGTITISGTPTASGTFNYTIPLTGACGSANATGTITVNPSMSVGSASSTPTVCVNTSITNITHTTTGATGIGAATGLPSGVSANYSAGTITISGTPTASGTFNYSIPLTGACGSANATGTITVNPAMTVGAASSTPTVCVNTAMTNVTHTTTNATGIGAATGLPSGVSANYSAGTITISGTPTASGTFNYSIPLTGACGSANATGTITVNPAMTVGSASSTPTVCVNNALTNITHTTTGATGIGAATGLPSGVSANYSAGTITISGTPIATGTFNYTIPLTGTCGSANATGTITVEAATTPTFTQVADICEGDALSPLPTTSNNSITGTWSPALDNMNTTMYTFTPTAGQCATTTTMTITVNAPTIPTFTQVAAICQGDALSPLPTTSNNGVAGSWSPALDNMNTTIYTFTPTAGQCASTTTMTITVNAPTTPTFTQVAAICQGDALSPLPTTSNNSITGTWSPALDNMNTTMYTFTPTAGQCATSTTMTITVNAPGTTPAFTQVADICEGDVLSPLPTTSNNGVTGSWSPALDNMNTTMYTFTPDAGQCATTTTMTITVNTVDVATIAYDQATFCIEGTNQMPTITGATGGSFSSTPAGLDLNTVTGEIAATTSSANTYTVSYLTTGLCPVTAQATVTMEICSGVKENIADKVKIFPSPASSVLTVQTTNLNVDQIRLMNVLGEAVIAKKVVANKTFLNVESLSMGVYFIQLNDESGKIMLTQKVSVK